MSLEPGAGRGLLSALQHREACGSSGSDWRLSRRIAAAHDDLAPRLELQRKLEGHDGRVPTHRHAPAITAPAPHAADRPARRCVNTVSFDQSGEVLVSGSDDTSVILWDWQAGRQLLAYESGGCPALALRRCATGAV